MCGICGCGETSVTGDRSRPARAHEPDEVSVHEGPGIGHTPHHHHHHHHHHEEQGGPDHVPHAERGPLGAVHAPGTQSARVIRVEQDLLAENRRLAAANRALLAARGVLALNLMSAPGAGKTTLLVRTIHDLRQRGPIAVIEGDQQTDLDAERIRATGVAALQINTGKGCHLDAHMIGTALNRMAPEPRTLLFIENVGNLVCPAAFDLGEAARVVMISVTEGDDKPLKYPDMFATADVILVTKIDLHPYVPFDLERFARAMERVRPGVTILTVSATSGDGLADWFDWIENRRAAAPAVGGQREPARA